VNDLAYIYPVLVNSPRCCKRFTVVERASGNEESEIKPTYFRAKGGVLLVENLRFGRRCECQKEDA